MKKLLAIVVLGLLWPGFSSAKTGTGTINLSDKVIRNFEKYIKTTWIKDKKRPIRFLVTEDGKNSIGWFCPYTQCAPTGSSNEAKRCRSKHGKNCYTLALSRSIKWKNEFTKKAKVAERRFSSKDDFNIIKIKLTALGLVDSEIIKKPKKIEKKKKETKISKKRTGKRALAMSWEGYDNLILGSLQFNEKDLVGSLNLKLPNNDGNCKGTYALSTDKGTWSLLCDKNNMSASGTLKWNNKDGSVTGEGKDTKGKKVKFTVQGET